MTQPPNQRAAGIDGSTRPAVPPFPEDPYTATRHLSAGAYLDDEFRDRCLREVYYQPQRLTAPSYGFDLPAVLEHCLRARNLTLMRDAAIIFGIGVFACVSWTSVLVLALVLITVQIGASTWRLAQEALNRLRTGEPIGIGPFVARAVLLTIGWSLASVALILIVGLFEQATAVPGMQPGYGDEPTSVGSTAVGAFLLISYAFGLPVVFALLRQNELQSLTPGNRPASTSSSARMAEIAQQQTGNTVVYSGFRPFVGSGDIVDSHGFALRLVRPDQPMFGGRHNGRTTEGAREFSRPPFDAQDLIEHVRDQLARLLPERTAEEHLPGLTITDQVFLAGTEVSRLSPHTPSVVMAGVVRHPTTPARHYLACQVISWGGELVTTVYVHIAVQGRSLYLETTTTALAPCREEYRVVSTTEGTGTLAWIRAMWRALLDTPRVIAKAPVNLVRTLATLAVSSNGPDHTGPLVRGYDRGARTGVRELGTDQELRNFTQQQDVLKAQRLIERRVLASVLDFLDARGIDTSEYRERAGSVLNVGVGHFGTGNMTFQSPVKTTTGPAPQPVKQ
jgi:hypothetical protein